MSVSCPPLFETIRVSLRDLVTDAAAEPSLVARYKAAGVNDSPVMIRLSWTGMNYIVAEGHETVAAMKAAGLTWCRCQVLDDGAYRQERALAAIRSRR